MRRKRENQLPLSGLWPDHRLAQELKAVSKILDDNPSILELVLHDLCDNVGADQGARGLSAEQVLRSAILKNWHRLSYTKLAFFLSDSQSFRRFARLPFTWTPPVPPACRRTSAGSKPPPGSRSTGCWSNGRISRDWNGDARFEPMPRPSKAPSAIRRIPSC